MTARGASYEFGRCADAAPVVIYGATGYTGRLVAEEARRRDMQVILAGRDRPKVRALAERLGFPYRVAAVHDTHAVRAMLAGAKVLLNLAGPFSATADALVDACLDSGTHYLDVTGEIEVFERLYARDAQAKNAGVMLLPGAGFAVVPSDCLARHAADALPGARRLRIGLSRVDMFSRGTVKTMLASIRPTVAVRRAGAMTRVPVGFLERVFDFGAGPSMASAVSWPDVFTAYLSTGVPNIETYAEMGIVGRYSYELTNRLAWVYNAPPGRGLLGLPVRWMREGPADDARGAARRVFVAEAEDAYALRRTTRLTTPEGYTLTPPVALALVERVVNGEIEPGYQTPAGVYGADFILQFDGVVRDDVAR